MSVFGVILVHIFPLFSRIRTEYGEIVRISSYSVQMGQNTGKTWTKITPNTDTYLFVFSPNAEKSGKNADQNNSEYGHFYAVLYAEKLK